MAIKLSEHFNYTKLLKFTIPTIVMMILTTVYGVVDGTFVSNFAGKDSLAAVNIIWPMITMFGSVGIMIGSGGSALISKKLGESKKQLAVKYFSMLIYFEVIVGIILSIIGIFIVKPLAILMGAENNILELGVSYGRILCISLTAFILQNSFQSFLIAAERPKLGLLCSVIAGVINMILDFLLIYVFKLGIKGAAIATGISQCFGGILPLIFFMSKNSTNYRLVITGLQIKPILKACSNGLSGMALAMSVSLVNMLYNFQLLRLIGPGGVISYGIVQYIIFFTYGFLSGYSNGNIPIVSFHYGAQNDDEIKNLFKRGIVIICIASIIFFGLTEALAPIVATIFVGYDEELYKMTVHAIRIYYTFILVGGYNSFTSAFFTGLNNGKIAAIIAVSRTIIFDGGSILVLPLIFGKKCIWITVTFAESISLLIAIALLLLKRKKYHYF
ncbi:mate-domain-containing protein [Anaeromyces robustus]|uniref:Mate-domain-containing protein n=1 Tax=Anaeromyces robustus TaxID=1754192 RepID=A0A1Y1X1P3_9FUNG|nr:mate-domain-containing protein [Anaeromyces robustus]|eukprot:ORX79336.1 mate-domain-containing protein [Anaeromyces robustus]